MNLLNTQIALHLQALLLKLSKVNSLRITEEHSHTQTQYVCEFVTVWHSEEK